MPNKVDKRGRDGAIARIAARQHGVVTRAQMLWVGVLPSGISDRVTAGRLHRIHRGVYAAGHPNIGNEGRWMAAVLACGDDAVLSHRSAAALWRVLPQGRGVPAAGTSGSSREGVIEVTVPGSGGRAIRSGIKVHRSQTLQPGDRTIRDGIPVTNPMRTLEDLRRLSPERSLPLLSGRPSSSVFRLATASHPTEPAASSKLGSSRYAAATAFPSRK